MSNRRIRKPLPDRQDLDNGQFWNGTDQGELQVKRCGDCGAASLAAAAGLPLLRLRQARWVASRPRGEVFSWTVVHRSQTPGFEAETPYAVVLVELDDAKGVRMVGNLVNCAPTSSKPVLRGGGVHAVAPTAR